MLEYENQMFLEILQEDGLVITAKLVIYLITLIMLYALIKI